MDTRPAVKTTRPSRSHAVESAVTRLLVAIKQLLESLTMWSNLQLTDLQISDVYVRLGNDFNAVVAAFTSFDIDMTDLMSLPEDLSEVLETCLAEDATPDSLAIYLPKVRAIITRLLQGLRTKQSMYRRIVSEQPRHRSSKSDKAASKQEDKGKQRPSQLSLEVAQPPIPPFLKQKHFPLIDKSVSPPPTTPLTVVIEEPSPNRNDINDVDPSQQTPPMEAPAVASSLAALKKSEVLERRASKRFSTYHISKMTGGAITRERSLPSSSNHRSIAASPTLTPGDLVLTTVDEVEGKREGGAKRLAPLVKHSRVDKKPPTIVIKEPLPVRNDVNVVDPSPANIHNERAQRELGFQPISSLDMADRIQSLIKRSTAKLMMHSWEDALKDADEIINIDPTSHRGYERRHAALHSAKRYSEAVEAFHTMLLKIDQSPDEHIHELRGRYFDARPTIRRIINATLSHMPRVLIDTNTGQLHNRTQLVEIFEENPLFMELVSSSTTREVDCAYVEDEVNKFCEYVMFSHKWEDGEPLLQDVEHTSVYELKPSRANTKLQTFCSTTHSLGYRWAWSDTCCVDKRDKVVLEESLVAMFNWYRGSALTLVHLLHVLSWSKRVGLRGCIWNTRAWTYQEYLAANRILFYTEDWQPYLGLTLSNHKESHMIIAEMGQATQGSAGKSGALQPGLDRVLEKLHLASMRQATYVEDTAYSLLGIFNVSIPVVYGEGNRTIGRLLEHILTGSGDVSILAWTGIPNTYNSCLPTDLTVYNKLIPPHIPQPMDRAEVDQIVAGLPSSIFDLPLVIKLYDKLDVLPTPSVASSRLRLPGIVFLVEDIVHVSGPNPKTKTFVFRTTTPMFGDVEIKTTTNLTSMTTLYLVHPWIRPLLDQEFSRAPARQDKTTRALRSVARLMQPFGALLFEQISRVEYRRVASDNLIMVQVCKDVSLNDLIDNIYTIDVQ